MNIELITVKIDTIYFSIKKYINTRANILGC